MECLFPEPKLEKIIANLQFAKKKEEHHITWSAVINWFIKLCLFSGGSR